MNSTMPLVKVSAEIAPISGQMLGGRMWYSWFLAPAMMIASWSLFTCP